jgi:hypothetical protein
VAPIAERLLGPDDGLVLRVVGWVPAIILQVQKAVLQLQHAVRMPLTRVSALGVVVRGFGGMRIDEMTEPQYTEHSAFDRVGWLGITRLALVYCLQSVRPPPAQPGGGPLTS